MKAKVLCIQSGSGFVDKRRRVTIRFEDADPFQRDIQLPESMLGLVGLTLDDELIVDIVPARVVQTFEGPVRVEKRHES